METIRLVCTKCNNINKHSILLSCQKIIYVKSEQIKSNKFREYSTDKIIVDFGSNLPKFYITFNTFDGRKDQRSIKELYNLKSITLQYKEELTQSKKNEVDKLDEQINSLKGYRNLIAVLNSLYGNHTLSTKSKQDNPKLSDINTKENIFNKYDSVNNELQALQDRINDIYTIEENKILQINNKVEINQSSVCKVRLLKRSDSSDELLLDEYEVYWTYND